MVGGAGTVGGTYFLTQAWFLDLAYTYARTTTQTFNYFSTYTNTHNPFGPTAGTLVGSSSGKVITQGITLTINMAFPVAGAASASARAPGRQAAPLRMALE